MNEPSQSKGRMLIAAYRAARLGQRSAMMSARGVPLATPPAEPEAVLNAPATEPTAVADPPDSVFARLVSLGPDVEAPDPLPSPEPMPARADVPLAAMGFGPGMLIRLGQIGFRTANDLACANAADLRGALGEISRLIDVESWIAGARELMERSPERSPVRRDDLVA